MSQESAESRRLLRLAAAAAADVETTSEGPQTPVVGSPEFLRRERDEKPVGFLDTVQAEYGLVVRWWLVVAREVVVGAALFWIVAFVIGLVASDARTMGSGSLEVSVTWAAVGITLLLRVVGEGIVRGVRARRSR